MCRVDGLGAMKDEHEAWTTTQKINRGGQKSLTEAFWQTASDQRSW